MPKKNKVLVVLKQSIVFFASTTCDPEIQKNVDIDNLDTYLFRSVSKFWKSNS